jgi:hypothetical protein
MLGLVKYWPKKAALTAPVVVENIAIPYELSAKTEVERTAHCDEIPCPFSVDANAKLVELMAIILLLNIYVSVCVVELNELTSPAIVLANVDWVVGIRTPKELA